MKCQPNSNYVSNDDVQTPQPLADAIVEHFKPLGRVLEPCRGEGAFSDSIFAYQQKHPHRLNSLDWMEIKDGFDFLSPMVGRRKREYTTVLTNPPWSLIRPFLQRSMQVADNVVFLMTINHAWTKARVRDVREAGFGMKEILLVDMPKTFPQSGFQLGAVHWQRAWTGDIKLSRLP